MTAALKFLKIPASQKASPLDEDGVPQWDRAGGLPECGAWCVEEWIPDERGTTLVISNKFGECYAINGNDIPEKGFHAATKEDFHKETDYELPYTLDGNVFTSAEVTMLEVWCMSAAPDEGVHGIGGLRVKVTEQESNRHVTLVERVQQSKPTNA